MKLRYTVIQKVSLDFANAMKDMTIEQMGDEAYLRRLFEFHANLLMQVENECLKKTILNKLARYGKELYKPAIIEQVVTGVDTKYPSFKRK